MLEMLLGDQPAAPQPDLPEEPHRVREHLRKPAGRRPLPEHLTRVEVEILPINVELEGLDAFTRLGEEVSEVLERLPGSLYVTRIVRPKFVRKVTDPAALNTLVLIAETPERPIERGLAGPGLLADTVVRRWQDHLPLHRQEGIYAREGVELARSTICGWHEQLADLAAPLVDAMMKDALTQPHLCTDATGVLVRAEGQCQRSHFWVLVAPGRHVLYRYSEKHDSAAVDRLLAGYKGRLVADAHSVYDHLYATGDTPIEYLAPEVALGDVVVERQTLVVEEARERGALVSRVAEGPGAKSCPARRETAVRPAHGPSTSTAPLMTLRSVQEPPRARKNRYSL